MPDASFAFHDVLLIAATSMAVTGGCLYVFYDYTLKKPIDNFLTGVFRRSGYEADKKAGRRVYQSDTPGFTGMMEEMKGIYKDHKGEQSFLTSGFTESMDLFFTKLGVNPDYYATFCQQHPNLSAWFSKVSANVTFSWVVGGAKIHNVKGNIMKIETCRFRQVIGEGGCIEMCKTPVENYFTQRMNAPIKMSPQPKEQGLGCKFCYGHGSCTSKDLEW